jgi:hypothetical protein
MSTVTVAALAGCASAPVVQSGPLKACDVVSEAAFAQYIGVDPGAGTASDDSHCAYSKSDGTVQITVQTSTHPDTDLPAATYYADPSHGGVKLTGVDRGYYVGPDGSFGSGGFLVVKNGKGVLVTIYLSADYTAAGVKSLADAIAATF